jgi:hypothetical protein
MRLAVRGRSQPMRPLILLWLGPLPCRSGPCDYPEGLDRPYLLLLPLGARLWGDGLPVRAFFVAPSPDMFVS